MFEVQFANGATGPLNFPLIGVAREAEARVALLRDWNRYSLPGEERTFVKVFDTSGDKSLFFITLQQWETFTPEQAWKIVARWLNADMIFHPHGHSRLYVPMLNEKLFTMSVEAPDQRHLSLLQQEPALSPEEANEVEIHFSVPLMYWLLDMKSEGDQLQMVGISR
jgi:hypothetical protein